MGLCIDASENKQGLDFEIKRDSINFIFEVDDVFYCDNTEIEGIEHNKYFEIDKKVLAKIVELCQDKEWAKKIFGE
jgi:hypothetical protein